MGQHTTKINYRLPAVLKWDLLLIASKYWKFEQNITDGHNKKVKKKHWMGHDKSNIVFHRIEELVKISFVDMCLYLWDINLAQCILYTYANSGLNLTFASLSR